jgi:hypothetical protein
MPHIPHAMHNSGSYRRVFRADAPSMLPYPPIQDSTPETTRPIPNIPAMTGA